MFQMSQMAHSCTELWLASVQPEGESQTCPKGMEQRPTAGPKGGQHWRHRGRTGGP